MVKENLVAEKGELTPCLGNTGRVDAQVMGLQDFGKELYQMRVVSHGCHSQVEMCNTNKNMK